MATREYDVVVLGAGSAGEVCAGRLAERGLEVAIVEPHLIGGECSFYACMPSKALLRPAEALAEARRVPGAAEAVAGELDANAALRRRDEVISNLDDEGQVPWLEKRGVELVRAPGALDGERRVRAGDDVLVARRAVVVATGTGAAMPPIDGLEAARPWTNREATTASEVPSSLVVLGGGPVGCEMSQAWASLGSRVSLVESAPRLLPSEEEFVGEQIAAALGEHGVEVRTGAKAIGVRREGEVAVELEGGEQLTGAELLVGVGRRPRTEEIGLDTVGIEPGGYLEVDDGLRVDGSGWLYAIGDVNGRALLTHMGKYQARICADVILGEEATVEPGHRHGPPRCVFTEPQLAAVGHTLGSAREDGIEARAVDQETSMTAGGSFWGRGVEGTTRVVVDERRRVLVGATFVGADVAELLHAATIAVVGEVPLERLWHAVPSFPTRSELWLKLMEEYGL